jgi:hypothetical protein
MSKWSFVKFMFWPVFIFLLIIGNLVAWLVTEDRDFLIIALLWLLVGKVDSVEFKIDRIRNGR